MEDFITIILRRHEFLHHTGCIQDFIFLGYSFCLRKTKNRKTQEIFESFQPAISKEALRSLKRTIKYRWKLKSKIQFGLSELARWLNPIIRGWFQYYGRFYKGAMVPLAAFINDHLRLWATHKYQKLWRHRVRSYDWLRKVYKCSPNLFAHWKEYPMY